MYIHKNSLRLSTHYNIYIAFKISMVKKASYLLFISTFICTVIFEDLLATKQPIITSLSYIFGCPLLLVEFTLDVTEFRS